MQKIPPEIPLSPFHSYKFMEDVLEVYENEFSAEWVRCISQTSGMNEREKEGFLEEFSASEGTLVGFCVMGGIFSEGIDLMGEKLIGAIIIGTGLPQIGTEREILRQYYDKKGVNGFDYAYRYPGMNEREKEEFLEEFSASEGTLVGFCVIKSIHTLFIIILPKDLPFCSNLRKTSPYDDCSDQLLSHQINPL